MALWNEEQKHLGWWTFFIGWVKWLCFCSEQSFQVGSLFCIIWMDVCWRQSWVLIQVLEPKKYCPRFGFPSIHCFPQALRAYPCISCFFLVLSTCLSLTLFFALFVFGSSFSVGRQSGVAAIEENLCVLPAKGSCSDFVLQNTNPMKLASKWDCLCSAEQRTSAWFFDPC